MEADKQKYTCSPADSRAALLQPSRPLSLALSLRRVYMAAVEVLVRHLLTPLQAATLMLSCFPHNSDLEVRLVP